MGTSPDAVIAQIENGQNCGGRSPSTLEINERALIVIR